ncbi:MAG: ABC transporter permease [Janthinobacterium lividum]
MKRLLAAPSLYSYLATAIVFAITVALGADPAALGAAALAFSSFAILAALGQMLVITLGPGNIDLSIPSVIALAGALAMLVMDGQDAMILPGLLAAIGGGMTVGVFNVALIRLLRIPPIIATLSSGLVVLSVAITFGRGLKVKPPPAFAGFTTARLLGIPLLAILAVAIMAVAALLLQRTVAGRTLSAAGQNARAATFAGLPVERVRLLAYVLCAALAALTGALLAGFSGGNSLDQGEEYLLLTIAIVVIGGTDVGGGRASVAGLGGAGLFMFLLVAMLNASGAGSGVRMLLTGLIIVGVITAAGAPKIAR